LFRSGAGPPRPAAPRAHALPRPRQRRARRDRGRAAPDRLIMKRLLKSALHALEDRTGLGKMIGAAMKHKVPRGARWWYVFGSATLLAFVVQILTGITLSFSYIASSGQAYDTLQFITNDATFGHFLRGLHFYGGSLLVLPLP